MNFRVSEDVFSLLPDVCFGVVVARDIREGDALRDLEEAIAHTAEKYAGKKAKEMEEIAPYREAFNSLGYNPNKFMPSIEALTGRILKQGSVPSILPVVDLYNSVSIKYLLPIGGHDMDTAAGDIEVRLARAGDTFTPFGGDSHEDVPSGELVYAVGNEIKTRRWIWRQGELGKITNNSRNIFFPIDGFEGINDDLVREAMRELKEKLTSKFGSTVTTGYINKDKREISL